MAAANVNPIANINAIIGRIHRSGANSIPLRIGTNGYTTSELQDGIDEYCGYVVKTCICNTTQLGSSLLSAVGSIFTIPFTGMAIEHPWMLIKAEKPAPGEKPSIVWLVAQSGKKSLELDIVDNEENANASVKKSISRSESAVHHHIHEFEPKEETTVNEVIEFMKEESRTYNAAFNNCQHFVIRFTHKFGKQADIDMVSKNSSSSFTARAPIVRTEVAALETPEESLIPNSHSNPLRGFNPNQNDTCVGLRSEDYPDGIPCTIQ